MSNKALNTHAFLIESLIDHCKLYGNYIMRHERGLSDEAIIFDYGWSYILSPVRRT